MKIQLLDKDVTLVAHRFVDGGGIRLDAVDDTGAPFARLSVNVPDTQLPYHGVILNTGEDNSRLHLEQTLVEQGVITPVVFARVRSGFNTYPVVQLTDAAATALGV